MKISWNSALEEDSSEEKKCAGSEKKSSREAEQKKERSEGARRNGLVYPLGGQDGTTGHKKR